MNHSLLRLTGIARHMLIKANEVNKLDRSKENNLFNCPTQLVSSSSLTQEIEKEGKRSRKVSYFVPRKQILRELKQILQYK